MKGRLDCTHNNQGRRVKVEPSGLKRGKCNRCGGDLIKFAFGGWMLVGEIGHEGLSVQLPAGHGHGQGVPSARGLQADTLSGFPGAEAR